MKRKMLTVTVSRTRQIKDYHPITIGLAETIELEEDDDPIRVRRKATLELVESVNSLLDKTIKEIKGRKE